MVTVDLKGIHIVRVKLADGKRAEYHYAWKGKGSPRLQGRPGSPEYHASYNAAHEARKQPKTGTLKEVIAAFKGSRDFANLGADTKRAYSTYLDMIEAKWGNTKLGAIQDVRMRRHFLVWRDSMGDTPRKADYAIGTLKRLLAWAEHRTYIDKNPAAPIERLHSVDKSESIWTDGEIAAFKAVASPEVSWVVELAAHTALRQGDLMLLPWSAYDGQSFSLRTSKRSTDVLIPATMACRALMARIPKRSTVILTSGKLKRPWTSDGFRASFAEAKRKSGVKRTFHDLRGTAVTNLLKAGLKASKVAMIVGWAEDDVEAMKRKYVSRSAVMKDLLEELGEKG